MLLPHGSRTIHIARTRLCHATPTRIRATTTGENANSNTMRRLCVLVAVLSALFASSSSSPSFHLVSGQSLESAGSSELILPNSLCSIPGSFAQSVIDPHTYYLLCNSQPQPSLIVWSDPARASGAPSSTILLPIAEAIAASNLTGKLGLTIEDLAAVSQTSSGVIHFPVNIQNNSRITNAHSTIILTYTPIEEGQIGQLTTSQPLSSQCNWTAAVTLMSTPTEDILLLACYEPATVTGTATAMNYYRYNLSSLEFIDSVSEPLLTWYNASWDLDLFSRDQNDTLITIGDAVYRVEGDSKVVQLLLTNSVECPWITSTLQDRINDILIVRCTLNTTLGVGSTLIGWQLNSLSGLPEGSSHSILSSVDCQQPSFTWYYRDPIHPSLLAACESGIGSLLLIQDIMSDSNRTSSVLFSNNVCQVASQVVRDQFRYSSFYLTCDALGIYRTSGAFSFVQLGVNGGCQQDQLSMIPYSSRLRTLAFDARSAITFLLCWSLDTDLTPLMGLENKDTSLFPLGECQVPLDLVLDSSSQILYIGCCENNGGIFANYSITQYVLSSSSHSTILTLPGSLHSPRLTFTGQQLYVFDTTVQHWNNLTGSFDPVYLGSTRLEKTSIHEFVVCMDRMFYVEIFEFGNIPCTLGTIALNATIDTNATKVWSNGTINNCATVSPLVCHSHLQAVFFASGSQLYRIDAQTLNISIEYSHLPQIDPTPENQLRWSQIVLDETNELLLLTLSAIRHHRDTLFTYSLITRYLAVVSTLLLTSNIVDVAIDSVTRSIIYRTASAAGDSRVLLVTDGFTCTQGYEWNSGQCQPCSIGTARGIVSATQSHIQLPQCQQCVQGSIAPAPTASSCQLCSPGTFDISLGGVHVCSPCGVGNYSSLPGQTLCQQCQPGRYADSNGFSTCNDCQVGRASSVIAAQTCEYCQPGRFMNETGHTDCIDCLSGLSQPNINSTECIPCNLGSYSTSLGSSCEVCPIDTYSPDLGQECVPCTNSSQRGLDCRNGRASVRAGWWPYQVNLTKPLKAPPNQLSQVQDHNNPNNATVTLTVTVMVYRTTPCPLDYCPGADLFTLRNHSDPFSTASVNVSLLTLCDYPQLNSPSNWLCADCVPDHIVWGQQCVSCSSLNVGALLLQLLYLLALIVFFYATLESSSDAITILMYFTQIVATETNSTALPLLSWIQAANIRLSSLVPCIGPMTPLQQQLMIYLTPLLMCIILGIMAIAHYAASKCCCRNEKMRDAAVKMKEEKDEEHDFDHQSVDEEYQLLEDNWTTSSLHGVNHKKKKDSSPHSRVAIIIGVGTGCCNLVSSFSIYRYLGTALSLLLFNYTSIAIAVVQSLHCNEIAPDVYRLFDLPSVKCGDSAAGSSDYHAFMIATYLWLIIYLCGIPLTISIFLFFHRDKVQQTYEKQQRLVAEAELDAATKTSYAESSVQLVSLNEDVQQSSLRHDQSLRHTMKRRKKSPSTFIPLLVTSVSSSSSVAIPIPPKSSSSKSSSTSSPLTSSADSNALTPFELCFAWLYDGYSPRYAWYWSSWQLFRQFAFALVSGLMSNTSTIFVVYGFLSFISLLAHLAFQPFQSQRTNQIEFTSHLLLIMLSYLLAGFSAPFNTTAEVLFTFCVIIPVIVLAFYIVYETIIDWRSEYQKRRKREAEEEEKEEKEEDRQNGGGNRKNHHEDDEDLVIDAGQLDSEATSSNILGVPPLRPNYFSPTFLLSSTSGTPATEVSRSSASPSSVTE